MMIPDRASLTTIQRLMGASLLVLANKLDIEGSMSVEEIRKVGVPLVQGLLRQGLMGTVAGFGRHQDSQLDYQAMQCYHGSQRTGRHPMGCGRCQGATFSLLNHHLSGGLVAHLLVFAD